MRPVDAVDLATLKRDCGPKLFRLVCKLSRYVNPETGEGCHPGLRTLARHLGIGKSTAGRWGINLDQTDIVDRSDPGGSATCRYRFNTRYLTAVFEARDLYEPDWHVEWGKHRAAVTAFLTNGTKGEADRTPPRIKSSTEPSESPTVGRSEEGSRFFDGGCADGCADAPPADLEASEKPETSERSSDAPLHPKDAAAPATRPWRAIERRQGNSPPDGPTLKAYKRRLWEDDIARFMQENELYAEQSALWAAELAGDEAAKQQLLDDLDRRMRAAGWRSPPDIRRRRRLNRRGEKRDPVERERAKQRLAAKVARWLEARARPGTAADFWVALMGPDAQAVFDKTVAAYRASGWEDRG